MFVLELNKTDVIIEVSSDYVARTISCVLVFVQFRLAQYHVFLCQIKNMIMFRECTHYLFHPQTYRVVYGSFTCLSREQLQGTLWLYITCD